MPVASASSNEEEGGACHGAAVGRQGGLSRVGGGVRRELDETPRIGEVHVHLQEIEEREVEGRRSKGGRDRTGGARSEERRRGEARRGEATGKSPCPRTASCEAPTPPAAATPVHSLEP